MTLGLAAHSISYVPETIRTCRDRQVPAPIAVLTKRRAVDFCRVSTAICCRPVPQPEA